ncbi:hypothetical protein C7974DRAFT_472500 [Boeremia exigua]|uniref:uncharacterized protein n=1 Tax=Boeremia exigua TaxID=749465 RepID=UPI001E8D424B|nr:uncharacterized protein C7974DRAFT_472500 [Boeremia exigua]KAH6629798.1 hypothetical protein C7974DRAFT_472500 [Boeremia exigua]
MQGTNTRRRDSIWDKSFIYDFQEKQWEFLVPTISTEEMNNCYGNNVIMPFIAQHASFAEGSFGVVSKYEIHEDHIVVTDASHHRVKLDKHSNVVAVKEIKIDLDKDRHKVAEHWNDEVRALLEMNRLGQDHIVRFITAFRYGKQEDPEHFLVFEWASGGNLQDLWKELPHPVRTAELTKAVIEQLLGLAKALNAAHNLSPTTSYRHGDLKPANILWFRTDKETGIWKIGDWGEAKVHFVNTEARRSNTGAKFGTRRYEPPEVELGTTLGDTLQPEKTGDKRRSRLYDIWAMGCIALELMIWLLYGQDELNRFNDEVRGDYSSNSPFYQIKKSGNTYIAEVHRVVLHWLQHMVSDSACRPGTTALGDVLEIIEQGLLVINLPQTGGRSMSFGKSPAKSGLQLREQAFSLDADESAQISLSQDQAVVVDDPSTDFPSIKFTPAEPTTVVVQPEPRPTQTSTGRVRFLAEDFQLRLEQVFLTFEEEYWYSKQQHIRGPQKLGEPAALLSIRTMPSERRNGGLIPKAPAQVDYAHPPLNPAVWTHEVDNLFALPLLKHLNSLDSSSTFGPQDTSFLCERCIALRESLWHPTSPPAYPVGALQASANAKQCKMCCLLWSNFVQDTSQLPPELHFHSTKPATEIQVGLPQLPTAGSWAHLEIVRQWLENCDTHPECARRLASSHHSTPQKPTDMPTRLIDVGQFGDEKVYLREKSFDSNAEWIALSHQWGEPPHYSTEPHNLEKRKGGMALAELPATFRDAVIVTRELGHRYLWIDSICIVQGASGDFHSESKRMENIYSGAYCVLAASCAKDHGSGFLQPRRQRDFVTLTPTKSDTSVYVCEPIDNFKEHVLDGALNRRGWVLQEHALARRTVFFTEHQTYFECGRGVRCETMTKMSNKSAELLGDPSFPRILAQAKQGERILRYQKLYQQYTRLGLTKDFDRPTAIDALQQKLLRTMLVKGGWGVLQDDEIPGTLRRSLLWHRGFGVDNLLRIAFPPDRATPPSWSWMAYAGGKDNSGGIDYFNPDFGKFDWQDMDSPWSQPTSDQETTMLSTLSQEYDASAYKGRDGVEAVKVVFDEHITVVQYPQRCVVLGIQRVEMPVHDKRHYILVIKATSKPGIYERVGAGYVPGICIIGQPIEVHIT